MVGRSRFVLNPTFERKVLTSPPVREWVRGLTEQVAAEARTNAPFREGHLEGAIEPIVEFDGSRGTFVGRVVSNDFKTIWHEFGTKKMRAHPFLRPALTKVLPGASTGSR